MTEPARGVEIGGEPNPRLVAGQLLGLVESLECKAVHEALRAAGGHRSRAAAAPGIGRIMLYREMHEFGIS